MPLIKELGYSPSLIFRSSHANTIYPFLFRRKESPVYVRTRFETSDDDFIDLDTLFTSGNNSLAIVLHGLEGSSDSQYIRFLSNYLSNNKWDVVAMNHRSCSGEMNRKLQMYHSGFTDDLHEVISSYSAHYDNISIIGFSLGGNVTLKYANDGIYTPDPKISSFVAVSAPIDLGSSGDQISKRGNILYEKNFLKSLKAKIKLKSIFFPDHIEKKDLEKVKSLKQFDDIFTGPLHGFHNGQDYYDKCSSKPHLYKVSRPTLLINAIDDPFLDKASLPYDIAEQKELLYFMAPKFGGHVGFTTFGSKYYWHEHKILEFINEPNIHNQ